MATPRDLTATYYNALPIGSVESSASPKPDNAEALLARRQAIRDGRLIVLDSIDETNYPQCTGCAASPIRAALGLADSTGGSPPTPTPPSNPAAFTAGAAKADGQYFEPFGNMPPMVLGDWTQPATTAAQAAAWQDEAQNRPDLGDGTNQIRRAPTRRMKYVVNGSVQAYMTVRVTSFRAVAESGTCTPSGATCVERESCGARLFVELVATKPANIAFDWPELRFDVPDADPAVVSFTEEWRDDATFDPAAPGPVDRAIYRFEFTWAVACGGSLLKMFSLDPDVPGGCAMTDPAAGWTDDPVAESLGVVWFAMDCAECKGKP